MNPPYNVSWYIQNQVLLIRVYPGLSEEQVRQMEKEAFELIRKAPDVVHAIVDLQASRPRHANISQALKTINAPRHRNQGTSVLIIPIKNPISRFVATTILDALGLSFKVCTTFEEAEKKIAKLERERRRTRIG